MYHDLEYLDLKRSKNDLNRLLDGVLNQSSGFANQDMIPRVLKCFPNQSRINLDDLLSGTLIFVLLNLNTGRYSIVEIYT